MPQGAQTDSDEIKDRFAAEYEAEETAPEAVLDRKTEEIVAARRGAAQRFSEMTGLVLSPEQQQALLGKRVPTIDHIGELFGAALASNPALEQKIGVRGKHLQEAALADRAAGRVVMAGQRLERGGELGSLLAAATMDGLCDRVLDRVRALLRDPQASLEQRSDAEIAFSEPFRLKEAVRRRGVDAQARLADVAEGPQAAIDRAAEEAVTSRLIEAFLTAVKKQGGEP